MSDVFRRVKENIKMKDVAIHYGFSVNRSGLICCPFHGDKHPSMKVDRRFYSINLSVQGEEVQAAQVSDTIDEMDEVSAYIEIIKENIEYEHLMANAQWQDKALYDELFEVICEVVCVKRKTIRIAGEDYPYELVKSKFLKLDSTHLQYVISCMQNTTTKIGNIKAYMITSLYNAPNTIHHYYQQEVQHDMYGGGWYEKGVE